MASFIVSHIYFIITCMKSKSLAKTNPFLKKQKSLRKAFIRNVASSTAVETGQSVDELERIMLKELEEKPVK